MIFFMYFMEAYQAVLEKSASIFNAANDLDVKNGGENFPMSNILNIMETYSTRDNESMHGETFAFENMTQFFQAVEDCILNASNIKKQDLLKMPFAAFKICQKNYGKQRMLLEIANTISKNKFDFKLFEII